MEIRVLHYAIVINCVVFIPYLLAKPFSLNKAIAEEVRAKHPLDTTSVSKSADPSISAFITKHPPHKPRAHSISKDKISSLKYKTAYKIRTPLKPKRLKRQKERYRNKIKTQERAIDSDEIFSSKYIPLLKSLSILFDNLLDSGTSGSDENRADENDGSYSEDDKAQCSCTFISNATVRRVESHEATIAPVATFTAKVTDIETNFFTETSTSKTDTVAPSNLRSLKRNKNLPVLSARNTLGSRRNNNGFRKGSSSTDHRSSERHLTRNNGDNERYAEIRKDATDSQNHEKYSDGPSRNYASGDEFIRRISRYDARNPIARRTATNQVYATKENSTEEFGRYNDISEGQNNLETGRHETESAIFVPNTNSGLRRHTIEDETDETERAIADKNYEESKINVTLDNAGDQRIANRDGSHTEKNKNIRRTDEALMSKFPFNISEPVKNKLPVVTIFDGYSIARDVNGENKLSEKAIHIHT